MQKKYCIQCGALLEAGKSVCTCCKTNVEQPAMNSPTSRVSDVDFKKSVWMVGQLMGNNSPAAAMPGEMTFIQQLPSMGGLAQGSKIGPFKCLLSGMCEIIRGTRTVFRDKKRLALVGVISCVWLVLLILPAMGVKFSALKWLNFLTFAQGGASGGVLGLAGGIIGKGLLAYFFTVLLLPVFNRGKPLDGIGNGIKNIFASLTAKDRYTLPPLLGGVGLALVCYNFLTVNNSWQNGMAGIAACLLALRALANKGGFLRMFLFSLFHKPGKGKIPNTLSITSFMAGWAAGFALGIPFSLTGISIIGYLTGFVLIICANVVKLVPRRAKEVQER